MNTVDLHVWRKLKGDRHVRLEPMLACPSCGASVVPIDHDALGRTLALLRVCERYRCMHDNCGWEGTVLLPDAGLGLPHRIAGRRPDRAPLPIETWAALD